MTEGRSRPARQPARLLRGFDFKTKRRREIEAHARYIGAAETDDLSRWLVAWIWHLPKSDDRVGAVMEAARRMGKRDLTEADAEAIIEEARTTHRHMTADRLARWLGLTYEVREKLGITTIGSIDVSKSERKALRKARDRLAKERRRRTQGAKPRPEYLAKSLSRTRPWQAMGISRRTWERRRRQYLATQQPIDASSGTPDSYLAGDALASAPLEGKGTKGKGSEYRGERKGGHSAQ
jgi:hypothetical protein